MALAGTSGTGKIVGRARATIRDGAARLADGTLAGSIISMLDGVRIMVEKAGVSIGEAAVMAATNPANLVGANERGRIQVGARADLIVLSPSAGVEVSIHRGPRAEIESDRRQLSKLINRSQSMPLNTACVGSEYPPVTTNVTLDAIQKYARAYNDDNPAFFDASRAGGIVAPPMFGVPSRGTR